MTTQDPAEPSELELRDRLLETLRGSLASSLRRRALIRELNETNLFERLQAVEACRHNPYSPASTGILLATDDHFQISLTEEVSRQLFLYGGYEESLTAALATALTPPAVFFDVGAHYGYFSVLASRLVGWRGRVVAFEPTPATAKILKNNLSGRQNCQVVEKAVWRRSGSIGFNDAGTELSAFNSIANVRLPHAGDVDTTHIQVDAVSLDDFVSQTGLEPHVMKIDVESAEMDVILGAENVLRTCRPMLTVEVGDFEHLAAAGVPSSRQVLLALIERGYDLFETTLDGLRPHLLGSEGEYTYDNIVGLAPGSAVAASLDLARA